MAAGGEEAMHARTRTNDSRTRLTEGRANQATKGGGCEEESEGRRAVYDERTGRCKEDGGGERVMVVVE